MCFGDKLEEKQIQEIGTIQTRLLLSFPRFNILNFWPEVGKVLFRHPLEGVVPASQEPGKKF